MSSTFDEPELPFEENAPEAAAPQKKTVRRGRPPRKVAKAIETGEVTGVDEESRVPTSPQARDAVDEPEVRIEGVALDDSPEGSRDEESGAEDPQEGGEGRRDQGFQRDRDQRGHQGNKRFKKKDFQKNKQQYGGGKFNKGGHGQQGKGGGGGGGMPPRNKPNRKLLQQRNIIALVDGNEAECGKLQLGDLPGWDVLQDREDMEELVAEFAVAEEALDFNALYRLPQPELREEAERAGIRFPHAPNRSQMLRALMEHTIEAQRLIAVQGLLEVLEDGNGLLVYPEDSYRIREQAVFVPRVLLEHFGLQRGHWVRVLANPPRESESAPYALKVLGVNGLEPEAIANLTPFTELVPYYPTERILLETNNDVSWDNTSMRVVDLLTPIGLGQRGLIVAPPRTGKTVLMQGMANAIAQNRPDVKLLILLVDERPEEVTDFRRNCAGEVVASTFDEAADSHVHAAEMVIEKARRMVEVGEHVVILLDSITRLARAYNTMMPNSGKILSGGVEANAMQKPKRFFGSARNIENGGSLTILGTALVETGSRMDEVIFEEFKGTGNMELHLDRALVDKRTFPALSFERCGKRKEEMLYHHDEMTKIYSLRRAMKGVPSTEAMEMLIQRVKKTKSNAEFLMAMSR